MWVRRILWTAFLIGVTVLGLGLGMNFAAYSNETAYPAWGEPPFDRVRITRCENLWRLLQYRIAYARLENEEIGPRRSWSPVRSAQARFWERRDSIAQVEGARGH